MNLSPSSTDILQFTIWQSSPQVFLVQIWVLTRDRPGSSHIHRALSQKLQPSYQVPFRIPGGSKPAEVIRLSLISFISNWLKETRLKETGALGRSQGTVSQSQFCTCLDSISGDPTDGNNMTEVEEETVDFYRNKLDQKDTELSTLIMLNKKMEMQTKREIKAAKIAEDQANFALKQERNKVDKATRRLAELEQQKAELEQRVQRGTQQRLNIQGEKKLLQDRINQQREEARRTQHLVPSKQFASKLAVEMQHLKGYEYVFTTLEEKLVDIQTLESELYNTRQLCLEEIQRKDQLIQEIKAKKQGAQKILRENSGKITDLEGVNSQIKKQNALLTMQLEGRKQLVQDLEKSKEELTSELQGAYKRVEELEQRLDNEGRIRQQQTEEVSKQQYSRFEQELQTIRHKFEDEQKTLVYNIQSIQESLNEKLDNVKRQKDLLAMQLQSQRDNVETVQSKSLGQLTTVNEQLNRVLTLNQGYLEESLLTQEQIEVLKSQKQKLESDFQAVSKLLRQLEARYEKVEQHEEGLMGDWQAQRAQMVSDIRKLEKQLDILKQEGAEMATQNHRLQAQIDAMTKESLNLSRGNSLMHIQALDEDSKGDNRGRNLTNQALTQIAQEEEPKLKKASQETQRLGKENATLLQSAVKLDQTISTLREDISVLESKNKKLQDLLEQHQGAKKSSTDSQSPTSQIDHLTISNELLASQLEHLNLSNKELEAAQQKLNHSYSESLARVSDLNLANSELSHDLAQLKSRFNTMEESLQSQCSQYIQEIITMKVKVAQSETRAQEKVYQLNKLKKKYAEGWASNKP